MLKSIRILPIFVLIVQILISSCVKQEIPILANTDSNYSIKSLELNNDKKTSLLTRPVQDTLKITQLNTEINNLNNEIQSLSSSVNSRLSSLNSQNQSLAAHVNTITKKQ